MDEYSGKEIAEIMEGVVNEDFTVVNKGSAESSQYGCDQVGESSSAIVKTEIADLEVSSTKHAAALDSNNTAENDPETHSNKSVGNDLDGSSTITESACPSDQPQCPINPINPVHCVSSPSPNPTISPLGLVQEVLRSPESVGDSSEEEPVITLDADNSTLNAKSKASATSTFYCKKTCIDMKRGYLSAEMRRQKSREVQWVKLGKSSLSKFDREQIDDGSQLNDKHINHAQAMIKSQFSLEGLQCTLFQTTQQPSHNEIQIIHSRGNHWIVASTLLSEKEYVNIYDSLYDSLDEDTVKSVKFLFKDESIKVQMTKVQKQCGGDDCGLFAIANAVQLAKKCDPAKVKFRQYQMRSHLINCFEKGKMTSFPTQRSKVVMP